MLLLTYRKRGKYVKIKDKEKEDCIDSIKQADRFYGEGNIYMCESWLFSPILNEFLPKNSNILKFQELFELIDWHFVYPQAEERIFGNVLADKGAYPEKTTLQKKR